MDPWGRKGPLKGPTFSPPSLISTRDRVASLLRCLKADGQRRLIVWRDASGYILGLRTSSEAPSASFWSAATMTRKRTVRRSVWGGERTLAWRLPAFAGGLKAVVGTALAALGGYFLPRSSAVIRAFSASKVRTRLSQSAFDASQRTLISSLVPPCPSAANWRLIAAG